MTNRWKADLERILESSKNHTAVVRELRALAAAMDDGEGNALLTSNPGFLDDYRTVLSPANYRYLLERERSEAEKFLGGEIAGRDPLLQCDGLFASYLYDRARAMVQDLDMSRVSKIVLVGCGWIPATLFYFHDTTEIPNLVGLDVNQDAILKAREIARRLGYTRIELDRQDGVSYDYSKAQLVYVLNMTSSKATVLSRIADTAPVEVQVLLNEPYSLGHLWFEAAVPDLDPRYEVKAIGPPRGTARDFVLTLRRETEA